MKFFLHVSQDEQRQRFLDRIDHPEKNWKFSVGDVQEREHWDDYMHAYEQALSATSTREAPWYVMPADDKKNARLTISSMVINRTLESLDLAYPKLDQRAARRAEVGAPAAGGIAAPRAQRRRDHLLQGFGHLLWRTFEALRAAPVNPAASW